MTAGHVSRMTPAEIDAIWLPITSNRLVAEDRAARYRKMAAEKAEGNEYDQYIAPKYLEQAAGFATEAEAFAEQEAPYKAEWDRRGGWTRYPFVTNTGGHYHENTWCSTCHPTTEFAIHPATSGLTRGELVENVGHHACTTCFPEAPALPSWHRTQREEAATKDTARAERTAIARAKLVKKIASAQARLDRALTKMTKLGATDLDRPKATDYIDRAAPAHGGADEVYYAACDRDYAREDVARNTRELARFDERH